MPEPPEPPALPDWPPGTAAILSTGAGAPHAIPVSTAVRAGERRVLFVLARRRESLRRLREDPRVALTLLCEGDVAVTLLGRASIAAEPLAISDGLAAIGLAVQEVQDHGQPTFAIEAGVRWRWTDDVARRRDGELRAALRELAERLP